MMKRICSKLFHGVLFLLYMFLYFLSFPLAFLLYKRKHLWLVSEVYFDARDNGYHFFKFLNEQHKEINSVYIISKKNKYFKRINSIGKSVEPGSYKHLLYFIASDYKIATLTHGCSPSYYLTLYLLRFHPTGKNISLKHGIFKNLHPNYFKKSAHLDMICCGAFPEFEFINNKFGYPYGVAKYTGLARFDNLHDAKISNYILMMPTWRRYLDGVDKNTFTNSAFFKNWMALLKELIILLRGKTQIYFYIHHKMNSYIEIFKKQFPSVNFISSADGDDLQTYLKGCKFLITDFSSTFFDIAYMSKPAVYFQFDEDLYYDTHYEKGYFDYRRDGFGPVATTLDSCLNDIKSIINNNFLMDDKYATRSKTFFTISDNKNCERIFSEILKL